MPIAGQRGRGAGGNLDQDDADAVRVLDPHLSQSQGSVAGARMTGTPAAASRGMLVAACEAQVVDAIARAGYREPAGRELPQVPAPGPAADARGRVVPALPRRLPL
jgi:hypothetical protein